MKKFVTLNEYIANISSDNRKNYEDFLIYFKVFLPPFFNEKTTLRVAYLAKKSGKRKGLGRCQEVHRDLQR